MILSKRKEQKRNRCKLDRARLRQARIRPVSLRYYLIVMAILLLLFVGLGRLIIVGINQHYQDHVRQLSINLAEGYVSSIARARQAEHVIDSLLDDKLLMASEATAIYTRIESNADVIKAAETMRVDEINIYDARANLLFTTIESLQDWKAYPGHPVYEFLLTLPPDLSVGSVNSQITQRMPDKQVIEEIIKMSHKLGLVVVAEGVELKAEKEFLEKCHCDLIQGYLLSQPLTQTEALAFLVSGKGL